MARSKSLPDYVLHVRTYEALERFAQAFAQGHLHLLILCGAAGLSKSWYLHRAVGNKACWIDGTASAFGVYIKAYEHCHWPIVLDDVDGLCRDRAGVRLLKSLCQTATVKSLSWLTDAKTLERRGIPHEFMTASHVAIIANRWQSLNAYVAALEDRGHFLLFEPNALEVHRHAASWFWDSEVFAFVVDHLHLMERPSLRIYACAWELKRAGLDWRQGVLSRCLTGIPLEVARLRADPGYQSEEDRVRAFVASGAGCRSTYFGYARKLHPAASKPDFQLTHAAPPVDFLAAPDVRDGLRRSCEYLENT